MLAGFLLVIFAFGITPKRTLHNLVATHKDGSANAAAVNDHDVTLSKATFNCQCDNLISDRHLLPRRILFISYWILLFLLIVQIL